MKRILALVLVICSLIMLLTACKDNNKNSPKSSDDDWDDAGMVVQPSESRDFTLNEMLLQNKRVIWYFCGQSNMGKDGVPIEIAVYQGGDLYIYMWADEEMQYSNQTPLTLGDIARMSDDEVLEYMETYYNKEYNGVFFTYTIPYYEAKDAVAHIVTDDSGNHTEQENLVFSNMEELDFEYYIGIKNACSPFQIYDSWFGGYATSRAYSGYYLIECQENSKFALDDVGTKNVLVDNESYKDYYGSATDTGSDKPDPQETMNQNTPHDEEIDMEEPERVAIEYVKAMYSYDFERMYAMHIPAYASLLKEQQSAQGEAPDYSSLAMDVQAKAVGSSSVSSEEIAQYESMCAGLFDLDAQQISQTIKVTLELSSDELSPEPWLFPVVVVEIEGSWYVLFAGNLNGT